MIRVLHVVTAMDRGGLETLIMNIYRKIDRTKIQFDFLTHSDNKHDFDDEILSLGGKIYSVPGRRKGILNNKKALENFFSSHPEYKIVHNHLSSLSYIEPLKAAKKYNVPIRIIHSHSTQQSGLKINKYLHFINRRNIEYYANYFFAVSEKAAYWLYGKKIVKQNKVKIIKNGIDVSNYLINEKRRNDNREKYGINESTLVIGHVGRFTYAKNHKFLLEVFNDIHNKTNNSKLILVGDGELKPKIKQYIAENNLDDSVIFTGVTNNVPMFLEIMDVYVFPSHYEGLSLSAVEAQASGLLSFLSTSNSTEVKLTDLVHFLPLEYNEEEWSKEILAKISLINRRSHSNEVKDAGFDISETVIILSNFYLELVD